MPVDWDKLDQDLPDIIHEAADKTDERLASKLSSITRLTDEEIQTLFPKPADANKLYKLMKIVKSTDDRNSKIAKIESNVEELGSVIFKLLDTLA